MKTRILICICLLSILLPRGFAQNDTVKVKLMDQVPTFEYEISPGMIQSIADLKGKVIMITFFATWCGPCRQELPHIQSEIYNKYQYNPSFQLLIFGREHSWEQVNKFKEDNKFTMPFYPDPKRAVYSLFADQYIPRNYLISPDGKVLFSSVGFVEKDFDALKQHIKEQLRKIPVR